MSRHYSPKTFLRTVRRPLLRKYFAFRSVRIDVPDDIGKRTDVDRIHESMLQLPVPQQKQIERDLSTIGELACPGGTQALLQQAVFLGLEQVPRMFQMARNHHERSLWAFLNQPDLFALASTCLRMDRVAAGRWRRRHAPCGLKVQQDQATLDGFAAQVRRLYEREGRGRYCQVDYYLRRDPMRHCFFAYPEDHACSELAYGEDGMLCRRSRRPTMEVICVYRPSEGLIEILAPGGQDYVEELAASFAATILGLESPLPPTGRPAFRLDVLRDRTFPFATCPEDGVEAVYVSELRCRLPGMGRRQVTFRAQASGWRPQAVYDLVDEVVPDLQIQTMFSITSASFQMIFTPEGDQRAKSLRFTVSAPDSCSLKDDPYEQIAKKCLRRWGIAQDGPAAADPPVRRYA